MTQLSPTRSQHSNLPSTTSRAAARGRVVAAVVVATMAMGAPVPVMAAGPAEIDRNFQDGSRSSARALTEQGQASFDAGDYEGAASSWSKILDTLPENDLNREERENALLISLEAYKHAYRRKTAERGGTSEAEVALLRKGLALCDAYTKEFVRVHGGSVSPAVVESRVEVENMLADSGRTIETTPTPILPPTTTDPDPFTRTGIQRGPSGNGLIAAGSATIVVGLAMIPLVVVGAQRSKDADEDLKQAMDEGNMEAINQAEDRKSSATAMIISGSILLGVLTVGGSTMLGIGIRRRIRYTAFSPAIGPRFVGLSLQGRF